MQSCQIIEFYHSITDTTPLPSKLGAIATITLPIPKSIRSNHEAHSLTTPQITHLQQITTQLYLMGDYKSCLKYITTLIEGGETQGKHWIIYVNPYAGRMPLEKQSSSRIIPRISKGSTNRLQKGFLFMVQYRLNV